MKTENETIIELLEKNKELRERTKFLADLNNQRVDEYEELMHKHNRIALKLRVFELVELARALGQGGQWTQECVEREIEKIEKNIPLEE